MASIENVGKMATTNSSYLLFIDTRTGESRQIDFPKDAYIEHVEQVKLDTLHINKIIVAAHTVNLDEKRNINWADPTQIIVLSTDGREKVQLTEDKFFTRRWVVNRQAGTIVITGHYDTNDNGKYDKTDKSEILVYDLQTLKLISKI